MSDLAKYSMTRSIARSLCDSRASWLSCRGSAGRKRSGKYAIWRVLGQHRHRARHINTFDGVLESTENWLFLTSSRYGNIDYSLSLDIFVALSYATVSVRLSVVRLWHAGIDSKLMTAYDSAVSTSDRPGILVFKVEISYATQHFAKASTKNGVGKNGKNADFRPLNHYDRNDKRDGTYAAFLSARKVVFTRSEIRDS